MFIPTKDGTFTIQHPSLNSLYHSIHGALQESKHVFIQSGINYYISNNQHLSKLAIFEMGFGTGLNCLLAFDRLEQLKIPIQYTSIDNYPLLNFDTDVFIEKLVEYKQYQSLFNQIHLSSWDEIIYLDNHFKLLKIQQDILQYEHTHEYDIIFFDAFAPNVQAELWNTEMMIKMYNCLKMNGILLTYCAQGQFKRNLKAAGFSIESIPGPPGKREMTRAHKS